MKILFTDLDGTLLDQDKKISPKNLEAIGHASDQENLTVIPPAAPFLRPVPT